MFDPKKMYEERAAPEVRDAPRPAAQRPITTSARRRGWWIEDRSISSATRVTSASLAVAVEIDGACEPNPGEMAYAFVARRAGEILHEASSRAGYGTNNVAEWLGLIAALRWLAAAKIDCAVLRLDSRLVVEQATGRWKVKSPTLKPLVKEGRRLLSQLQASARVSVEWIARRENTTADSLAAAALSAAPRGKAVGKRGLKC